MQVVQPNQYGGISKTGVTKIGAGITSTGVTNEWDIIGATVPI